MDISSEQPEVQGEKDISNHAEFDSLMAWENIPFTEASVKTDHSPAGSSFFATVHFTCTVTVSCVRASSFALPTGGAL